MKYFWFRFFNTIFILFAFVDWALAYKVPIGIPSPIKYFDGFDPLNTPSPVVKSDGSCIKCPNWPNSVSPGCYFIDNTNPNATDANNPYGYPNKPRLTIPEISYPSGAFIYINGGTYSSLGDRFDFSGKGTSKSPIWFCGNPFNKPNLERKIHFHDETDFFIIDSINVKNGGRLEIRQYEEDIVIKHVVIRNCEFAGRGLAYDGTGLTIGKTGSVPLKGSYISDIVLYNNIIHDYGKGDNPASEAAGVEIGYPTERLWVLKNEIYGSGSDAVAGCHTADYNKRYAKYYFIGDNYLHDNGENAIDLKAIQHYVISHNNLTGQYSRENGWAIVLHYGANSLGCTHGWVLFNKIHNAGGGIAITDANIETYVLGNIIYNIIDDPITNDPIDGSGIGFRGMNGLLVITNNTLYNFDGSGIICDQEKLSSEDTVIIENNIICNMKNKGYTIRIDGGWDRVTSKNNNYYNPNGHIKIFWRNSNRTLDYMKQYAGKESSSQEGDPKFVNPPYDFSLKSNSPCIDKGFESPAYISFKSEYGFDIKQDILGTPRPQGAAWDIGAIEYKGGGTNITDPPPKIPMIDKAELNKS